jgi:hypothetical protein
MTITETMEIRGWLGAAGGRPQVVNNWVFTGLKPSSRFEASSTSRDDRTIGYGDLMIRDGIATIVALILILVFAFRRRPPVFRKQTIE